MNLYKLIVKCSIECLLIIDWSGFALKLSLLFIGIMNNSLIPLSPITAHVPPCSLSHLSTNNLFS